MSDHSGSNSLDQAIHELKHYLPAQASLKDFIHHNTLHAFQNDKFFTGIRKASAMLGYRVSLSLTEYRRLYSNGEISDEAIQKVIEELRPGESVAEWKQQMTKGDFPVEPLPRIGKLRSRWKSSCKVDLDSLVHPSLFRLLCSFLDQGISIWDFPHGGKDFLQALRELERLSAISFFRSARAKKLLLDESVTLENVLAILVGEPEWYAQYIFDQQFAHQGWSGMVSVVEDAPETLLDSRRIRLSDLILVESIMEVDALDSQLGASWKPLATQEGNLPERLFDSIPYSPLHGILELWQEAFERSFHDQVLAGIRALKPAPRYDGPPTFQALFCIDDRECSLRRYIEDADARCQTFGTPGFFGVEFYFRPQDGKFLTKLCPAPVTPKYVIAEQNSDVRREKDPHFTKSSHGLFRGWFISQTLGFWSAVKLFLNVFRPTMSPATASSFRHMDKYAALTIEHTEPGQQFNGLQIGFTKQEMVTRVEALLKSIGLVGNFAPLVYVLGHGSSSVNNPHFAAYDCGACSGRAGSVNARVVCAMANDVVVRDMLRERGIIIPTETRFVGGLHDTTRDEVVFFDEWALAPELRSIHNRNEKVFSHALDLNAKERSRRFASVETHRKASSIHDDILIRSVSLFEPRPELNHATNALCVVGRRSMTDGLFLDRRAFMNSYDYRIDPDGTYLLNILRPIPPVCGGINLEYFFSRTDNQKLGAGTKLPHNVMGLFAVANGTDGDLRPGLPSQMIEVHDPVRLLVIVEHHADVVLQTIQRHKETYDWFLKEWVLLVAVDPETRDVHRFHNGAFKPYEPAVSFVPEVIDLNTLVETHRDNIPVHFLAHT